MTKSIAINRDARSNSLAWVRPKLLYDKCNIFPGKSPPHRVTVKLKPWEEVLGLLLSLVECDGMLLAEVGKVVVALPIEMKPALSPLVGSPIGILRTDIPNREYLVRSLSEKQAATTKNGSASIDLMVEAN